MNTKIALIISCEHGVNTVPKEYQALFKPFQDLLNSHRGIDFGALSITEHLKKNLSCDAFQATTSRLLIDCNRSLTNPHCFSEVTKHLTPQAKQQIEHNYYAPYRQQVIEAIQQNLAQGMQVWHLSIHSFTPILQGEVRQADVGFLYDPRRFSEKTMAKRWQLELKQLAPNYKIRMNYPYKGTSDGFTSALRKTYSPDEYLGIEVESNQALTQNEQSLSTLKNILTLSLLRIMC